MIIKRAGQRRREEIDIAKLKSAISAGRGRELISERDELEINLFSGERVTAVCARVDEDKERHTGRAEFVSSACLDEQFQMNDAFTNKGGYFKSRMRRHILEDIYPTFPPLLATLIEPKRITEKIDGDTIHTYTDTVYLLSATDVFGEDPSGWYTDLDHSWQLPIFAEAADRVRRGSYHTKMVWWLRTPVGQRGFFACVQYDGQDCVAGNSRSPRGVVIGFCL